MHVSSTLFKICPNNQPDNSCLRAPRYHGQLLIDLGVLKIHTLKVTFFLYGCFLFSQRRAYENENLLDDSNDKAIITS